MKLRSSPKIALLLLVLMSIFVSSAIGTAQDIISVAGEWTGNWTRGSRKGRISLHLKQEGERVWGTYDSPDANRPILDGEMEGAVKGNVLSLKVRGPFGFIEVSVKGDVMEGRASGEGNIITPVTLTRGK